MVFADVGLVERALQNLIENAIKYTQPNGSVTLGLEKKGEKCRNKYYGYRGWHTGQ